MVKGILIGAILGLAYKLGTIDLERLVPSLSPVTNIIGYPMWHFVDFLWTNLQIPLRISLNIATVTSVLVGAFIGFVIILIKNKKTT